MTPVDLILWRSMVLSAQRSPAHQARPTSWLARVLRSALRSAAVVPTAWASRRDTSLADKP